MINTQRVINKVFKEAEEEITKWGVKVILQQMGFTLDKYTNGIELSNNNNMIPIIFKDEDVKDIVAKISRKIDYNLKNHLLDILEREALPKVIKTTQDLLTKQATLLVEQKIYEKIFKTYKTQLEDALTEEVMADPIIKQIMIGKL